MLALGVDVGRVRRIADHHRGSVRGVHEDALVADGMTRCRHHAYAVGDLSIAVEELETRAREVEPLDRAAIVPRPLHLRALDVERSVLENSVLPAVVEMEVAVDHDLHVGGAQVVLGECVRGMAVDDLPLLDQLLIAPPHTAVDQDRARARVLDDEAVHRDFVEVAEVSEMKAYDLEGHGRKGDTAKTAKRTAT